MAGTPVPLEEPVEEVEVEQPPPPRDPIDLSAVHLSHEDMDAILASMPSTDDLSSAADTVSEICGFPDYQVNWFLW